MTAQETTARMAAQQQDRGQDHYDLVVIGAGPAGSAAALRAGELGARVALLDRSRLGGTCTNSGCVPTRVLAIAARRLRDLRGAAEYGIHAGEPRLDWAQLRARVRATSHDITRMKRVPDRLREVGGEVLLEGAASFVDAHAVRLAGSGRVLTGERFILASGGRARRLPFEGAGRCLTPNELSTLDELPRSAVIVGSGYTGVQVASILRAFGAEVTLLETAAQMLPPADADVSRDLRASFEGQGVRVVTDVEGVERVHEDPGGQGQVLTYAHGGRSHTVRADAVILAVGWPADVEALNLQAAGVELERGFVRVDEQLRTSAPHIYAVGDVNGRDMLVQGATFEAERAAQNAVLGEDAPYERHLLPSGGFTDPDHAGVGLTERQARDSGDAYVVAAAHYDHLERAIIDRRTPGFLKLIARQEDGLIIGAHGTGENAVEVMQAVATAMAAGATARTLAGVRFAYPTYTAIVGEAARTLEALRQGALGRAAR